MALRSSDVPESRAPLVRTEMQPTRDNTDKQEAAVVPDCSLFQWLTSASRPQVACGPYESARAEILPYIDKLKAIEKGQRALRLRRMDRVVAYIVANTNTNLAPYGEKYRWNLTNEREAQEALQKCIVLLCRVQNKEVGALVAWDELKRILDVGVRTWSQPYTSNNNAYRNVRDAFTRPDVGYRDLDAETDIDNCIEHTE